MKRLAIILCLAAIPLFAQERPRSGFNAEHFEKVILAKQMKLHDDMDASWNRYKKYTAAGNVELQREAYQDLHRSVRFQLQMLAMMDEILTADRP